MNIIPDKPWMSDKQVTAKTEMTLQECDFELYVNKNELWWPNTNTAALIYTVSVRLLLGTDVCFLSSQSRYLTLIKSNTFHFCVKTVVICLRIQKVNQRNTLHFFHKTNVNRDAAMNRVELRINTTITIAALAASANAPKRGLIHFEGMKSTCTIAAVFPQNTL